MRCKVNNFDRAFLVVAFGLLFSIFFASAQSGMSGTVNSDDVVTSSFLGSADQSIINRADNYVKLKLGDDYYSKHVVFESGSSYEECTRNDCKIRSEVYFKHNIPFDVVEDPHLGGILYIIVTLNEDGDVVRYIGPVKPYEFLISKDEAISFAKGYGLVEVTSAGLAPSYVDDSYELVWAVSSNDISGYGEVLNEPLYKGVYVDVDSGEIVGEYNINPMIAIPSSSGGVTLGEFFDDENPLDEGNFQKSNNFLFVSIIVIVALIIVLFVLYKFYRR